MSPGARPRGGAASLLLGSWALARGPPGAWVAGALASGALARAAWTAWLCGLLARGLEEARCTVFFSRGCTF